MALTQSVKRKRKLDKRLSHLAPNERTALAAFVDRLRQRYGDDLLHVVLFGSKARGDFDEESDLDVLVVLRMQDGDYYDNRRQISAIAGALDLEHDIILSTIVVNELEYTEMRRSNLLLNRNIHQDGIELWTLRQSALTLASV
jgi:predicted nucleotidyltransferase